MADELNYIDVASDSTMKELVEQIKYGNALKAAEVADSLAALKTDIKGILSLVRNGLASKVFDIGDQIVIKWTDVATSKEYDCPLDVVAFPTATLQDGEEVPAMRLQWHYCTPFGVQFNQYQAFYYAEEELPAGTYYIELGTSWGTNCVAGKNYQFTLTKPVPAGGQLAGFRGAPDQAPSSWKVYSYENKTIATALETVSVEEGNDGTKLGVLKFGGDGILNCLQRTAYGYNRWGQSALRQWLNSDAGVGQWWTPQNNFDRVPDQLATKAGFLTGFEPEIRDVLKKVKVVTALNTVTDSTSSNGVPALEVTYDKMFPLSLEQMYINPQIAGEGEYCEYWRRASEMPTKMQWYQAYPQVRTFAIESHTSPQTLRLRSALRGYSYLTWCVDSSGHAHYYYVAINAYRCAPACDIC